MPRITKPTAKRPSNTRAEETRTTGRGTPPSPGLDEEGAPARAGARRKPPAEQAQIFKDLAHTTSRIVQQAASILEEEIAAGIIAAKQIEERLVDVDSLRSTKPEEVVQRLRRDAHDVVDILVDIVHVTTKTAGSLARRMVNIRASERSSTEEGFNGGPIATLKMDHPVRAGESATIPLAVENDSDQPLESFEFRNTELVSMSGERISGHHITFDPAALTLRPHSTERVVVTVTPPHTTPPGTYSGLLQATKLDHVRAVLVVQII
jgi:hypothetical protein